MSPSRHGPCPCGSGRKFKNCCGKGVPKAEMTQGGPGLPPELVAEAREIPVWQADMVGVSAGVSGEHRTRMVVLVVTAGDLVIWTDVRMVTATEIPDIAGALEEAVVAAAGIVGVLPEEVLVRHEEVAGALSAPLLARGCRVAVRSRLPELDPLVAALSEHISGKPGWPAVAPPETWAAWGLPDPLVAELFRAFARFHEEAPWRFFDNLPPVVAEWDDLDAPWAVSVMGSGMGEYGLAVYSDPKDLPRTLGREGADNPFENTKGWIAHLGYLPRWRVGKAMVKEISRAGWELASTDAYPLILPLLTPGGGLQQELVRRFIELLLGVVALAGAHGEKLRSGPGGTLDWREGRLHLRYLRPTQGPGALDKLPPAVRKRLEELQEGGPMDLEELRSLLGEGMDEYNATPQEELGGISPDQARRLVVQSIAEEGPLSLATDLAPEELDHVSFLQEARDFLARAAATGGLPATAGGNLKRSVVADLLESSPSWDELRGDLRSTRARINEEDAWPLHVLRVNLELAGLIKKAKGKFVVTRKGKEMARPEAAGALYLHLFRIHFGKFDLRYGSRLDDEPDLQGVFPLLLWQIGAWAESWIPISALAEALLPGSAEVEDVDEDLFHADMLTLVRTILLPLARFGLVAFGGEEKPEAWRRVSQFSVRTTPLFRRFLSFHWD